MKRLAIIGSNDLAQLIAHHAVQDRQFEVAGFFDNKKAVGTSIASFGKVLGNADDVEVSFSKGVFDELIIGVGYTQFGYREAAFERFYGKIPMANMIHSSAYVDASCVIGKGVVLLPGCVLDMEVELENNVLLNTAVSISHHSKVKAHSFLGPRVCMAGFSVIGSKCFVGIGTTIIDNLAICDGVQIGGGSLIIKNIEQPGIYFGHPAKQKIK